MTVICINNKCNFKNKCGTFGEKNEKEYQNYAVYAEEYCKKFVKKKGI